MNDSAIGANQKLIEKREILRKKAFLKRLYRNGSKFIGQGHEALCVSVFVSSRILVNNRFDK